MIRVLTRGGLLLTPVSQAADPPLLSTQLADVIGVLPRGGFFFFFFAMDWWWWWLWLWLWLREKIGNLGFFFFFFPCCGLVVVAAVVVALAEEKDWRFEFFFFFFLAVDCWC